MGSGHLAASGAADESGSNFQTSLDGEALWCVRRADTCASVTLEQLHEQQAIDDRLMRGATPASWKVLASAHPTVFCLGGDLALFLDCVSRGDEDTLLDYGLRAAHCVWMNASGCGPRRLRSVALVEGEAQGGGFEAALSCHWIVATRGASFGFPESLFGIRPGMGAHALLSARVGSDTAERMIASANRYPAEFLHELGIVDVLADVGDGKRIVGDIVRKPPQRRLPKAEEALLALPFERLVTEVERWVEAVMQTTQRHQRSMRYLLEAQRSRAYRQN